MSRRELPIGFYLRNKYKTRRIAQTALFYPHVHRERFIGILLSSLRSKWIRMIGRVLYFEPGCPAVSANVPGHRSMPLFVCPMHRLSDVHQH